MKILALVTTAFPITLAFFLLIGTGCSERSGEPGKGAPATPSEETAERTLRRTSGALIPILQATETEGLNAAAGKCTNEGDRWQVTGYALDTKRERRPDEVIVVLGRSPDEIASTSAWTTRADLAENKALGEIRLAPVGFQLRFQADPEMAEREGLRFFALFDGTAAPIRQAQGCARISPKG